MDPRIGMLNSGRCYAYVNGYHNEPFNGTLLEVHAALGLAQVARTKSPAKALRTYDVKLTFKHPAWDEVDGIDYQGIVASSKSDANKAARRQAERDGHVYGRGPVYFRATEVE
jgi:hypothetical protein